MAAASEIVEIFTSMNALADRLSLLGRLDVDTVDRETQKLTIKLTGLVQRARHEDEQSRTASSDGPPRVERDETPCAQSPESQLSPGNSASEMYIESDRSSISTCSTASSRAPTPSTSSRHAVETRATKRGLTFLQRGITRGNAFDDGSDEMSQSPMRSETSHSPCKLRKKRKQDAVDNSKKLAEAFEQVVETFGAESDLEIYESIVTNAEEWPRVLLMMNFPSKLLISPTAAHVEFFHAVSDTVKTLEDSEFAEKVLQVQRRSELAHFYLAYEYAQTNPLIFISWTESIHRSTGTPLTPNRGRTNSVVKQRFVDLGIVRSRKSRAQLFYAMSNWRSWGKPWAELIQRFGYAGLLLVPSRMNNDYVHKMPQDEFTRLLQAIEARRSHFAAALEKARKIMQSLIQPTEPSAETCQDVPKSSPDRVIGMPLGSGSREATLDPQSLYDTVDPSMIMLK